MTLVATPHINALQSKRLQADLLALISRSLLASTRTPGRFWSLTALSSAYAGEHDGKYYLRYDAQVKDQEAKENITLTLTFVVSHDGDSLCLEN